jgi:hypothetical protein
VGQQKTKTKKSKNRSTIQSINQNRVQYRVLVVLVDSQWPSSSYPIHPPQILRVQCRESLHLGLAVEGGRGGLPMPPLLQ